MVKKKRQTIAEAMAALEQDPEYLRRRQERDRRIEKEQEELQWAEKPVVEALRSAGVRVNTVWDLVNTKAQYPTAVPILLEHLQRSYPDMVLAGIARALAVPAGRVGWEVFINMFRANQEQKVNGLKTALACALSGSADEDVMGDVIDLVKDRAQGDHRIVLLSALATSSREDSRRALQEAADDPQLRKEARVQLRIAARKSRDNG